MSGTIIWTKTDESPALSSASFLPLVEHFTRAANIDVQTIDISFAGRILQAFPEYLTPQQRVAADMQALSSLVQGADANIIKLPNASATENQLKDAVAELRAKGFNLPEYPDAPKTAEEKAIKQKYDAQTGSVVNPVLRQGNAVRSIPAAVKSAAQKNPHAMGQWRKTSKTSIAHMQSGDFYETEESFTLNGGQAGLAEIRFVGDDGTVETLKSDVSLQDSDIVDTAVMRRSDLRDFLGDAMVKAKQDDVVLSLHLKATMMKKTDGVIFGDALVQYFAPVFAQYADVFARLGVEPKNGLDDLLAKLETLKDAEKAPIFAAIDTCLSAKDAQTPDLAMVNSKQGTTHLSSPNFVIMDVSMANLARWGGELPDRSGGYRDTLAVIPDSTYARLHQAGVDFLKENGAADPATMGSVTTIRLQAEGAEEYGSKDTSFEAQGKGRIQLIAADGTVLNEQDVEKGDLWRLCRTSEAATANWTELAIAKARQGNDPVVFWLDKNRAHDAQIIAKVERQLKASGTAGANVKILSPEDAMTYTLERSFKGENTIAVTGNLVGDHITDYFPILEIGSSAKMLSVIQLLNGGIVAETGSGGTAPDLLDMVAQDNHFLWDDVGTALALVESLEHLSQTNANAKAAILAETLANATKTYIEQGRSPAPNGLDARQSHFYLSLYWAQALAAQTQDQDLQVYFAPLAADLKASEAAIVQELQDTRGTEGKMDGRYHPSADVLKKTMRPSATFSALIP